MQPDLNQKIKQNIFNLQASHEKLLLIYQGYRRQYVGLSVSAIFVLSGCKNDLTQNFEKSVPNNRVHSGWLRAG